jgi:hypothetical protein
MVRGGSATRRANSVAHLDGGWSCRPAAHAPLLAKVIETKRKPPLWSAKAALDTLWDSAAAMRYSALSTMPLPALCAGLSYGV